MHGHAHARACQLNFLLLYIVGAGLEDGEVPERYFSKLNAVAGGVRHASTFHRRQMLAQFAYHNDNFETYGNLSKFLYNNYRQALSIFRTQPALVAQMKLAGFDDPAIFTEWLVEEGDYLRSLSEDPPEITLQMEYYTNLAALKECRILLKNSRKAFIQYTDGVKATTTALERTVRHAAENERKLLDNIHMLEEKLNVKQRWTDESEEWLEAERLVSSVKYRRALDRLEMLLVSRIFELSRLNVSGTGEHGHWSVLSLSNHTNHPIRLQNAKASR